MVMAYMEELPAVGRYICLMRSGSNPRPTQVDVLPRVPYVFQMKSVTVLVPPVSPTAAVCQTATTSPVPDVTCTLPAVTAHSMTGGPVPRAAWCGMTRSSGVSGTPPPAGSVCLVSPSQIG